MRTETTPRAFQYARFLRIDRYVLSEVIPPFLGGILFFSFVFLMFQAFRLAEFFIIHGASGAILLKLIALMVLSFLPMAMPAAFLIAILMGFGRLSSDSELVAMKASGLSVQRLTLPVIFLAFFVVAISLGLNIEWVPRGDWLFKQTFIKVSNTKVVTSIKEGTFTSGFFDLLVYADKVDTKNNRMSGVFIYDEREAKTPMTIIAKEGEILSVRPNSQLGSAAILKLYNGNIHRNDLIENTYQKIDFGEYRLYLSIDEGSDSATIKPRMIPYSELTQRIEKTTTAEKEGRELRAEFWRRYAVAMTPLLFVFLGVGYGTVRTRAIRTGAALVAFIVLVLYYLIQASATIAAQKGILPPFVAMQLPNLIVFLVAVRAYRSSTW